MPVIEIMMSKRKSTDYKTRFKDNLDRVGSIYLSNQMAERIGINGEITIELAPDKDQLKPDGYVTSFVRQKETLKKVRYNEDTRELGALGVIYVSKKLLEEMGCSPCDTIALRIPGQNDTGGEAYAQQR
ncbi:MAG: hypothetical protein M1489_06630 [Firmicutes bacterium]|nr:hypothetical protein [Bacillota bacterium]